MNLRILLPFGVFCDVPAVSSIVAQTRAGAFGLLAHRLDCIAALVPGILTYTVAAQPTYLAADEGVLVKQGGAVTVSLRHCIRGASLDVLHETVAHEFLRVDADDQAMRQAIVKMESGLLGGFRELQRER